jgi:hypothetical protein
MGFELLPDYLDGARFRFEKADLQSGEPPSELTPKNGHPPQRQIALL